MSEKKIPRNQRRKQARAEAEAQAPPQPTAKEIIRKRRNRRFLFVAVVLVALPILEFLAYRNRSIQIIVANKSDFPVTKVKVSYPGGSFETDELKAGAELTHAARPDFSFTRNEFSTYRTMISFVTPDKGIVRQNGRTGTVDYSAHETYAIQPDPETQNLVIRHSTTPGFPLGAIRDLFRSLGGR